MRDRRVTTREVLDNLSELQAHEERRGPAGSNRYVVRRRLEALLERVADGTRHTQRESDVYHRAVYDDLRLALEQLGRDLEV